MMIRTENLGDVVHGFFGRRGGVSMDDYDSLNCSFATRDDSLANVEENRRRVIGHLHAKATQLQTMKQVHKADVLVIDKVLEDRPEVDAIVTRSPDVILGVLTADCVPILMADKKAGVVAAVHAGWPSAFQGIVLNSIAKMMQEGASTSNIKMAIGPCIRKQSYEIDPPFYKRFLAQNEDHAQFFEEVAGKEDRWLFDLPAYVVHQAQYAGVTNIEDVKEDTYANSRLFFSYRRHMHDHGHGHCGRQMSVIALA